MEGYSVTEAATILGVPTERVWELLARGVLAGTSEGEAGMRVYLQPRQAPAPAPIASGPGRPNGNDEPREPERELSPFRELLTEFRNLTERYGQALLALGESRGEVATLRSRVDLLEARMDLRLPMAGFTPPTSSSPWPSASVTPAVSPPSEALSDEHGADEGEDEHDRPARRRRSSQRRATESFAEALARAEDPTRSELPGASDVATALAALRDEPGHAAGATATEAVLPRELPAADLMPFADEIREPAVVAAEPEPVAVEQREAEPELVAVVPEPEPESEVVTAEPKPVADEQSEPEQAVDAAEPEPVEVGPPGPGPVVVAAELEQVNVEAAEVEPAVTAAEQEPVDVERPESERETVPAEPEPVAVDQREPEPGSEVVVAAEPEPAAVEQPEGVADVASAPDVAPIGERETEAAPAVDTPAGVDAATPVAEAPPISEQGDRPQPEDVPVAAEPEPEPEVDKADVRAETAMPPIGGDPEAEEFAVDLEPVAANRTTIVGAEPAGDQPEAVEPIAWDRERYTVDIEEPDWFAGEEPQSGDQSAPEEVPAIEDHLPDAEVAEAAAALPEAAPPVPEPAPGASAAHRDEETMLWFGRQPPAPAAEPAEGRAAIDERADDGASEMEVAGSGHRAQLPGSQELDDALAALSALSRDRAEPPFTNAPDEPVEETAADAWPRADTSAWTPPPGSSQSHAATPASRAYRRLRRIFPD